MASQIKIFRVEEFIGTKETGAIDVERSKLIIRKLALASIIESLEYVLLDMRTTTVCGSVSSKDLLHIAVEFGLYLSSFNVKIANVIPDDEQRIALAGRARDIIRIHGDRYQIFTSFEKAIDWLEGLQS